MALSDGSAREIQLGGLGGGLESAGFGLASPPGFGLASPPARNDEWARGAFGAAFPLVEVAPPAAETAAGLKTPSDELQRV
eukprot:6428921-Prymnesium_polylepis.1